MLLPTSIDLSDRFALYGLSRRVQGRRGTCSVFTVAQALEYALAVGCGTGIRLSVEYLNWAARQVGGGADDGGFFSDIWAGYRAFGCCEERHMVYQEHFDPLLEPSDIARNAAQEAAAMLELNWIKDWNPELGISPGQLDQMRAVLANGVPVCGGLRWPRVPVWRDSILSHCPPESVFDGHSVLLVGYITDRDLPGGGAFRIRNSNEPAQGLLPYEYVSAYLNDAAWISIAGQEAFL